MFDFYLSNQLIGDSINHEITSPTLIGVNQPSFTTVAAP